MTSKRVLLTGGTGFVGANLARHLLRDGHEVHLLLRPSYNPWRLDGIKDAVRSHVVNLSDMATVSRCVRKVQPEWIMHLAAYGAYPLQTDLRQMVETNVVQTMNLLQACFDEGFEAFVNTGSSSEYGFQDHPPAEFELPVPNSEYAVTKLSSTTYCRFFAAKHKVRVPTLRLYSVYGPFEEPTRLVPQLLAQGFKGQLPPLVSPDTARDYIYTDDACEAFVAAAQTPTREAGEIYNVGSGVQTTLREIVSVVRKQFDIPIEPDWGTMQSRGWDTGTWVADNRKILHEIGWSPKTSLIEGLNRTANWLCENPAILARCYKS